MNNFCSHSASPFKLSTLIYPVLKVCTCLASVVHLSNPDYGRFTRSGGEPRPRRVPTLIYPVLTVCTCLASVVHLSSQIFGRIGWNHLPW
eukprot:COSAG03_NODE_1494_length_3980_cov_40.193507_3_plen_90_part_00